MPSVARNVAIAAMLTYRMASASVGLSGSNRASQDVDRAQRGLCEYGLVQVQVERMKVCLNGGRGRADHPAVPLTPAELAMSAAAAIQAGAEAVHAPRSEEWLRILVEVIDVPAPDAVAAADEILRGLDDLSAPTPRLLHGEGPSCWPLIAHAGRLGLATRIGLEDVLAGPDGALVSGNAELVQLALPIWSRPERRGY